MHGRRLAALKQFTDVGIFVTVWFRRILIKNLKPHETYARVEEFQVGSASVHSSLLQKRISLSSAYARVMPVLLISNPFQETRAITLSCYEGIYYKGNACLLFDFIGRFKGAENDTKKCKHTSKMHQITLFIVQTWPGLTRNLFLQYILMHVINSLVYRASGYSFTRRLSKSRKISGIKRGRCTWHEISVICWHQQSEYFAQPYVDGIDLSGFWEIYIVPGDFKSQNSVRGGCIPTFRRLEIADLLNSPIN